MVQILAVANGTALLRGRIAGLYAGGYRVTMYDMASVHDIRRAAPDLLILAADASAKARALLAAIRADAHLSSLPVIMIGESWECFGSLLVALLTDTVILPAPVDDHTLRDATRTYIPTLVRGRHSVHAVA